MTFEKFVSNNGIKKYQLLKKWVNDDLIPGANIENDYIPELARPPYTNARARTEASIYKSILNGTNKKFHVLPQLYKISQQEFDIYIEQLVKAELLTIIEVDKIKYYRTTFKASNCSKKFILSAIESCSYGISKGIVSAVISA